MKTRRNKFSVASIGLGLFVFAFTFSGSLGFLFLADAVLNRLFAVGNESTAVQSLSSIRTFQAQYASKHQGKFAPNFDELIKSVQLDEKFRGKNPIVDEHIYKMTVRESFGTSPAFYSISADPIYKSSYFESHIHFYYDSTLDTIKYTEENRSATASDPSI